MTQSRQVGGRAMARNFLVLFLSNTIGQLLFLGGTIVVARSVGTVAYGWWAFAHAVFGYLHRGQDLGLEVTAIRAIGRDPGITQKRVGNVLVVRMMLAVLLYLVSIGLSFAGVFPPEARPLINVLTLGVFPVAVSLEWLFEALQTPLMTGIARVLKGLVFFVLAFLFVGGAGDLLASVGYYVVSLALPAFVLMIVALRRVGKFDLTVSGAMIVTLLRESLPIGIAAILSQYTLFFGTTYLGYVGAGPELGLYSASHRLVVFVWAYGIVASNRVLLPRLSGVRAQTGDEFHTFVRKATRFLLLVSLPIGIGGSLLAGFAVVTIYGPSFAPATTVFQILVWALVVAVVGSVFEVSLIADERQHVYLHGMILAACVQTITAPIGLLIAGIEGISVSLVFTQICYVGYVMIRSGSIPLKVFAVTSWKILLAGAVGLAAGAVVPAPPLLATVIALVIYAAVLWLLKELTAADGVQFLELAGLRKAGRTA